MSLRFALVTAGVAAAALALGIYVSPSLHRPPPEADSGAPASPAARGEERGVIGQRRPAFSLPDASGRLRGIEEWDGDVLIVNFWASWCMPCREEMPMLVDLQAQYGARGLSTLGIAADTPEQATAFAETLGVNYPSLFAEREVVELGKRFGNVLGVLPYTVVIDRGGIIRFTHFGLIERAPLERALAALL